MQNAGNEMKLISPLLLEEVHSFPQVVTPVILAQQYMPESEVRPTKNQNLKVSQSR